MQSSIIENPIQSPHLDELCGYLPGRDEVLMAWLSSPNLESYREVKVRFGANAREAPREPLEDPAFAGRPNRLPFRAGDTGVGTRRGYRREHRRLVRRAPQVWQLRHRKRPAQRYPHQPAHGYQVAQGGGGDGAAGAGWGPAGGEA